jgi:hypothetical protein
MSIPLSFALKFIPAVEIQRLAGDPVLALLV